MEGPGEPQPLLPDLTIIERGELRCQFAMHLLDGFAADRVSCSSPPVNVMNVGHALLHIVLRGPHPTKPMSDPRFGQIHQSGLRIRGLGG